MISNLYVYQTQTLLFYQVFIWQSNKNFIFSWKRGGSFSSQNKKPKDPKLKIDYFEKEG